MADRPDFSINERGEIESEKSMSKKVHPLTKALQIYYSKQPTGTTQAFINDKDKLNSINYCQNMAAAF